MLDIRKQFMRKTLLYLALVIGFTSYAGAKIEWDHLRHNFGAFSEDDGKVTAVFTYYNRGDEPLLILGARANCGCTTPEYSREALAPGDSATLSVTYDPGGRPGRFEKFIFVDSNTEPRQSKLSINGVSVGNSTTLKGRYPVEAGPLRLAHPAALLGSINRGEVKSVFEAAYNSTTDTLHPVIRDVPVWLNVKAYPEVVSPGEQVSFSYFINSDRVPEWDLVTDTITIIPDPSLKVKLRMPVVITVNENFSKLTDNERATSPVVRVDPERLQPVTLTPEGATAEFKVHNDGRSPLKIRRIYSHTPGVSVDVSKDTTVKPGKSKTVKVTVPPGALNGSPATSVILLVVTNDPYAPKRTVAIPLSR